ncbi:MAG: hypothetical protein M1836_003184 [Candelina mexicana]|nr:MAG: hypothetical protein M1836_003184 [Candelina mexicana]
MTILSKSLNALGLLLLVHACYSAHEHSSLQIAASPSSPPISSTPASVTPRSSTAPAATTALPLDITLETLASVLLLCLGLVLGSSVLKPIEWRVWAGEIERGRGGDAERKGEFVGNPFAGLEERAGFVDVRARRREFAEWVREQEGRESKS